MKWPASVEELSDIQEALAVATPNPWHPGSGEVAVGGVFVCFGRGGSGPGAGGDVGWAGAAFIQDRRIIGGASVTGTAGSPYRGGYLAMREGRLLEAAARALVETPDVLLVNATGRDHPRRAGLALHLGAVLGVPTVGITHRPLLATGDWPQSENFGATTPLLLGGVVVGYWVRTRAGRRPLAVHAAWKTSPDVARAVTLDAVVGSRTPEPLREARRLARTARSAAQA